MGCDQAPACSHFCGEVASLDPHALSPRIPANRTERVGLAPSLHGGIGMTFLRRLWAALRALFDAFKARFGNLSGIAGDTVATSNTMTMFELHFWRGCPLTDSQSSVAAFLAQLRSDYGIA